MMTEEQSRAWFVELARRIREARRARGLRQADCGIGNVQLCRIERGHRGINVRQFNRLRRVIGAIEIPALPGCAE